MIRIINYRDAQSLIARKTQRLEEAERVVAPILEDVRRGRCRAARIRPQVRRFRRRERPHPGAWIARAGIRAGRATSPTTIFANTRGCSFPRETGGVSRRPQAGPDRAAARFDGRVHARGPLSPALDAADERDSGAGGRRQDHLRRVPASQRRDPGHRRTGSA